jgi:VanZ family protein
LDKLGHFAAFAVLAALLCCAALALWRPTARLYASIFAVLAGYGALDELSQRLSPGRSSDFRDWIADCAGASIGILGFALFHRLIIRPQPPGATIDRAG